MVVGFLSEGVGKRENREGGNNNEGKRGCKAVLHL
jgi:hypothetical protein